MNLGDDVDLEDYVNRPEKISAADIAAITQEAGLQVWMHACLYICMYRWIEWNLGDDVDLEDYVNRPEKISAADIAAITQEVVYRYGWMDGWIRSVYVSTVLNSISLECM